MSKIIFVIGLLCVVQLASSLRIAREAPASEPIITLKDITTQAESAVTVLHDTVLKFANVSSDNELHTLVRTQGENYAEKLKTLAVAFTDEVKANSDKFDDFFKSIADKFTETANELKASNPQLASFQDTISKSFQSVLEESQKLTTKLKEDGAGISDNTQKILKQVYENTLETAKTVSDQLVAAGKKD